MGRTDAGADDGRRPGSRRKRGSGKPSPAQEALDALPWLWSDTLQLLIDHNHPPDLLQEYTLEQVRAYSDAIDRGRRRRHIELALVIRAAENLSGDDFADFLKG